jgi:hypothetical protein
MAASSHIVLLISRKASGKVDTIFTMVQFFNIYPSHINIDNSVCQALKYRTDDMAEILVIYDICCQWIHNFSKRIGTSQHLSIPESSRIIPAAGKFHLGAHIRSCFPLFSLNFVQGAGQQDGEIWRLCGRT